MPLNASIGVVDESTYGTPVTVTRFFEFVRESIRANPARVESSGLRAGHRAHRSDRFVPIPSMGAAGDIELEVHSKGFGFWLKHMLGAVGTAGPTDEAYTHTGTVATLQGDSFTCQVNRPDVPDEGDQAFTYHGGKITSWRLANSVSGLLMATLSCDFEDVDNATAKATPSYPSSTELFSWAGGVVEIGDSAFHATSFEVSCNNQLRTDRRFLRGSALKKEPIEQSWREITFTMEAEFEDDTHWDRVMSATRAGALAKIEGIWTGLDSIGGGTTKPSLEVELPAARFDGEGGPVVDGPGPLTQRLTGKGLYNGTDSPVSLIYVTGDTTP